MSSYKHENGAFASNGVLSRNAISFTPIKLYVLAKQFQRLNHLDPLENITD